MARHSISRSSLPVPSETADPFGLFHPLTAEWFRATLGTPTTPQRLGWPVIARGESALILAPTGTGKTLTAFIWCLDRLLFHRPPDTVPGTRIVYISPLKALAVDVERNLRVPLAGIADLARRSGTPFRPPEIAIRTGDTPQSERSRFRRHPSDILITTPESLYLLLTSESALVLRTVDTVIVDEIHALVPTKRGAHLALSLERLEAITAQPLQRIGLSATQRPLEEVALFLGGYTRVPNGYAPRPVTIVNAGEPKRLQLKVELPVEDLPSESAPLPSDGPPAKRGSIWTTIPPRLLAIIRSRSSPAPSTN